MLKRTALLLLLILLSVPAYATNWCEHTSMSACWLMDGTSGSVIDSSGNGHTMVSSGDPVQGITGVFGSAVEFDGNDNFNRNDTSKLAAPNNKIVLGTWVYFNATGAHKAFLTKSDVSYLLHTAGSGALGFVLYNGGWYETTTFGPSTDTWYHIVGYTNGTTMYIYVDGIEKNSRSAPGGISGAGFSVGLGMDMQNGARALNGKMDDAFIMLDYAGMTGTDINEIMNFGLSPAEVSRRVMIVN